ncbi:acetylornithine transaminase [Nostocoides australiense]
MTAESPQPAPRTRSEQLLDRYEEALLGVFGRPQLVIERGEGCYIWDADGKRYLDLLAGIAVNALGHNHPELVAAVSKQVGEVAHISNFFTSGAQIELAERLLAIAGAPEGSRVFFTNSGTEALEGAVKLARRTGRTGIIASEGAFHGRSTGALALTAKPAYREPFEPLIPGVSHIPYGDADAVEDALAAGDISAVVLEPIQGEGGVIVPPDDYLTRVRELTHAARALLILDEVQTGIGRTGDWFAFQRSGIQPDAITIAKGLGGGIPVGALVTFGPEVSGLLQPGMHGSTFGGNPLASAAGLAVLSTIERDGLLRHTSEVGDGFAAAVLALGHPQIREVRGRGLLRGIALSSPIAPAVMGIARADGFIVNAVAPDAIRIAPPLIITAEQLASFTAALPGILDRAVNS